MAELRNHAPWCSFAHDGPCPAENEAMAMHRGEIPMPPVPLREAPVTPSEREQRIEAAAKRRYESYDRQWEAASPVARTYYCEEAAADLDAADEAVPVVRATWDGLLEHLDAMYPADVFTGESGDVGARLVALARRLIAVEAFREEYRDGDDGAGSYPPHPGNDRPASRWRRLVGPWERIDADAEQLPAPVHREEGKR